MDLLTTRNLSKTYGSGKSAVHAISDINLSIQEGEFIAIVGSSGSGKSTLMHLLGGVDRPTDGTV